jgi:cytochrome bd ubiquinol oxidase subunit II
MESQLPLIWAGIIATAVAMYVILDGFDLGVGTLSALTIDRAERDRMIRSIAPFWDGNETWLVFGGVGLFVAFPRAYAIIMPALYIPVIVMLLALVFRGVAFEFRELSYGKNFWDLAFAGGSIIAGFCQGVILGELINNIRVENGAFAGGLFDWVTPFPIVCGFGVVTGYALLGATWLVMKTDGRIAERARNQSKVLLLLVMGFMAIVSIWTPIAIPRIAERWFAGTNFLHLWPIPLATAAAAWWGWRALVKGRENAPFLAAVMLFGFGYLGLCISTFPYLVPPSLTIWEGAAAPASQMFLLAGALVLLPLIFAYTALIYWLFRGKLSSCGKGSAPGVP